MAVSEVEAAIRDLEREQRKIWGVTMLKRTLQQNADPRGRKAAVPLGRGAGFPGLPRNAGRRCGRRQSLGSEQELGMQ